MHEALKRQRAAVFGTYHFPTPTAQTFMRFQKNTVTRPKDRPGANGGGHDQSSDTKSVDPMLLHPQSDPGIGSSRSSKSSIPVLRRLKSNTKPSGWRTRFSTNPHSFCSRETGNTPSEILAVPGRNSSVPDVNVESEPAKLSNCDIDPSAAYEKKPNWKSTVYASTKVVIDLVRESSDLCTPLKSVAGGLSAILKHYDVRYTYFASPPTPLTAVGTASDGESTID